MKKMSTPIVFAMLLVASVALNGEAATDLIINEISPVAPEGGHAWVEFYNPTPEDVILAGLVVGTAETEPFEVPDSFPSLQPGGYLVLRFGPGPYGLQVEDGPPQLIVFTAPSRLAEVWVPSRGEIMIERPDPMSTETLELVDYVAWGAQGAEWSRTPERLRIRREGFFVPLEEGFGIRDPESSLAAGESIGLYPGQNPTSTYSWVRFADDEATPGLKNVVPCPKEFNLADEAVVGGKAVAVGWPERSGDDRYRFQLSAEASFDVVVLDSIVDTSVIRVGMELPPGTYYYRVKAMAGVAESKWCTARRLVTRTSTCDPVVPLLDFRISLGDLLKFGCGSLPACKLISSIEFKFQRKDTHLVCLHSDCQGQGCPWDEPHPYCIWLSPPAGGGRPWTKLCASNRFSRTCGVGGQSSTPMTRSCAHGSDNCVRASISMLASAFKACLSQDLIAYQNSLLTPAGLPPIPPEWELGHKLNMNCSGPLGGECSMMLRWALGIGPGASTAAYTFMRSTPAFQDIRQWIDAEQPIMTEARTGDINHARVLAGYCEDQEAPVGSAWRDWVFIFDPKTGPRAEPFVSWRRTAIGTWVAPPIGAWQPFDVERDSSDIWNDYDNDGLMDFDEIWRFSTSPFNLDTSGDGVGDKEEDLLPLSTNPA